MKKYLFLIIGIGVTVLLFSECSFRKSKKLEISYYMQAGKTFVPSRQTTVWLEKPDGSFYKSLYVSEYMAYGGYLVPGICPEWSDKAEWQYITQEEFDAVTGATPATGKVDLKFEFSDNELPQGEYILLMEIHLAENYNVLCQTTVSLTGKKGHTPMDMKYVPGKYSKLKGNFISNVKVVYK